MYTIGRFSQRLTLGVVSLAVLSALPSLQALTPKENNAIAEKFFDTAWNKGDFASVENLLSKDVVDHSLVPGEKEGPEKFKAIVGMFRAAMPDVKMTIEDEIYTGDKVLHRWKVSGTHKAAPLFGVPPAGKPIVLTGITIVRLQDGKFVERWTQLDQLGLLNQLGVVPAPPKDPNAPKHDATPLPKDTSGKFTPAQNNAIAEKFFESAWNKGDFASVENLLSKDVVDHSLVPGEKEGPEKFKQIVGMFRSALPDVKMTIEDEIYVDDKVAHRWMVRGTHTGTPLFGVPATKKTITLTGITIVRLVNGQFAERWTQLDQLGLLGQLGMLPPPPGKGPKAAAKETPVNPKSAALGGAASINASSSGSTTTATTDADKPKPAERSRAVNLIAVRSFKMPVNRPMAPTQDFWVRDNMTGNWDGFRDHLYDRGLDLTFATLVQGFHVDAGSRGEKSFLETVSVVSFDYYPGKTGGWKDTQLHVTGAHVDNADDKNAFAGSPINFLSSSDTYNTVKLFEFWVGKKFAENTMEIRIGKCLPFVRIGSARSASVFLNGSFQYPSFLGFGIGPTYLAAPLGVQFSYQPVPEWFFIGQVSDGYDDPTQGVDAKGGFDLELNHREGAEGIFEAGYRLNQRPTDKGLPGNYKLGFQFHTGEFNTRNTSFKQKYGNFGGYAIAEQMFYREGDEGVAKVQGLTAFLKTSAYQQDLNTASLNVAGGLFYQGLLPSRTYDILAAGYTHTSLGDGLRSRARSSTSLVPDAEHVFEMIYIVQIAPWWAFEIDFQHIRHPRGLSSQDDINVYALSSRFAF